MLLVSEVAGLGKEIEKSAKNKTMVFPVPSEYVDISHAFICAVSNLVLTLTLLCHLRNFGREQMDHIVISPDDDSTAGTAQRRESVDIGADHVIDMTNRDPLTGSLNRSEKLKIMQLLERWEEPNKYFNHQHVSLYR